MLHKYFHYQIEQVVISPLNLAAFDGGKYLVRNLEAISSQVAAESFGKELNHIFAL